MKDLISSVKQQQSHCHFQSTVKMFLWFESISSLLIQVNFSHSVLMLGFPKLFLRGPNHVPNHLTNSDQIPYELNAQYKNWHCNFD